MPDNPIVWIAAIVATAVVVLVALWKGQLVEVELKPPRLRFRRRGAGDGGVSVGAGLTVENATTGDIAGVKSTGRGDGAAAPSGVQVTVAQGARISGSRTGDIVGIKQSGMADRDSGSSG